MSKKHTKASGKYGWADLKYLDKRRFPYSVRIQVPHDLQAIIEKRELKGSVGSDPVLGLQKYYALVTKFQTIIREARNRTVASVEDANLASMTLSQDDIDFACYAHFRRMVKNMRGKVAHPIGDAPALRLNRIEGYRMMIENHIDLIDLDAWPTMEAQALWLCDEHGWVLDTQCEIFEYLCRTMLRARLQSFRDELRLLEGNMSRNADADALFGTEPPAARPKVRCLGDLIDEFNSAREDRWTPSTRKNYIVITRVLEEICGRNTPVDIINREFCWNVRTQLMQLPKNYQKLSSTKGRSIGDAIGIAAALNLPLISPATAKGHLNKFGAIIRFGRDAGWITGNPMASVEIYDPVHPAEKRDPFSIEQLTSIFSTDPWKGLPVKPSALRPSRYWVPLIALYSGARLTDICGQRLDEMIEEDGIPIFNFVHRPDVRRIKGGQSRKVPVHPALIELGFWEYVEAAKRSGQLNLFSDCKPDKLLKWGDATSKWFARKIRNIGIEGRNLALHSLRHSFEDALRRADIHDTPIGNAITGRSSYGVSKNYGSRYPVRQLHRAIMKVKYPGFVFNSSQLIES